MPAFTRFQDLSERSINRDLHIHTVQTDGKHSIAELIAEACRLGLKEIAFTEHVRRDTSWFGDFSAEVRRQAQQAPVSVYVGLEAKALDTSGMLDANEEILKQSELVLGSVHRFPDGRGGYISLKGLPLDEAASIEFELAMGLLRSAPIHVLAHPGGMCLRAFGEFPEGSFRALMAESLKRSIAIEISSSYLQDFAGFVRICREENPYVSVGSDVHRISDLGNCRNRLRELGIA